MNRAELNALERNIRLRNGRREIPREIPRPASHDAFETLGHLAVYSGIAATIFLALWFAFSVAERQLRIEDQINQEINHVH